MDHGLLPPRPGGRVRLGVAPPRLVGTSRALDLLASGRVFTSEEAAALGLVSRVVPAHDVLAEAQAYARDLAASCSPASMAVMKRQVYEAWDLSLGEALARANELMVRSLGGPDFVEGVQSYMGRRPPAFSPLGEGTTFPGVDVAFGRADRIAVLGAASTISTIRPDGTGARVVSPGGGGSSQQQVAWSPGGRRLAWGRTEGRAGDRARSSLVTADPDGGDRVATALPTMPFYVWWRPDGRAVACLANGPQGIDLLLVDPGAGPAWPSEVRRCSSRGPRTGGAPSATSTTTGSSSSTARPRATPSVS